MIDAKMKNGDLVVDTGGNVVATHGVDAAFQRAVISMTVPKGSFIYDRELGTPQDFSENIDKMELSCMEGLAKFDYSDFYLVNAGDSGNVTFNMTIDSESREEEVLHYGNIS